MNSGTGLLSRTSSGSSLVAQRSRLRAALPAWLQRRLLPFEHELARQAADFCRRQARGLVLDLGSGAASYAPGAIALDADFEALARRGGSVICADAHRIPIKPGCMDAICCSAALHHFIDPQVALREMHRCVRKRGKLFLSVPHRFPPTSQIDDRRRFTRTEILRLLETTGWSVDECEAIGGRNWTVSRALLERAFPDHGGLLRLRLLALGVPVLVVALACFYLDKMRRPGDATLGWAVIARRETR